MIGSICSDGTNSTTSISRLRSSGSDLRSSSVSTTVVDPSANALSMWAYSTAVFVVHLVQIDVVIFGCAVKPDRHIHQAEADGTLPDRPHAATVQRDCAGLHAAGSWAAAGYLSHGRHRGSDGDGRRPSHQAHQPRQGAVPGNADHQGRRPGLLRAGCRGDASSPA